MLNTQAADLILIYISTGNNYCLDKQEVIVASEHFKVLSGNKRCGIHCVQSDLNSFRSDLFVEEKVFDKGVFQ